MIRTFAVTLKAKTLVDGIEYPAGFQVGAVTSECGPMSLLGLIQYKHATIEEVADLPDDDGETSGDEFDGDSEPGESATSPESELVDTEQSANKSNPPDAATVCCNWMLVSAKE